MSTVGQEVSQCRAGAGIGKRTDEKSGWPTNRAASRCASMSSGSVSSSSSSSCVRAAMQQGTPTMNKNVRQAGEVAANKACVPYAQHAARSTHGPAAPRLLPPPSRRGGRRSPCTCAACEPLFSAATAPSSSSPCAPGRTSRRLQDAEEASQSTCSIKSHSDRRQPARATASLTPPTCFGRRRREPREHVGEERRARGRRGRLQLHFLLLAFARGPALLRLFALLFRALLLSGLRLRGL